MLPLLRSYAERARATLPRAVFDYYDGGSGDEVSRDEAAASWRSYRFRPRVLVDIGEVSTHCELLGRRLATPVLVAPMAWHGYAHPDGELATADGVQRSGSLQVVSTRASRAIEQIAPRGPWWMQVYVTRERAATAGLVERAVAVGAEALVLTGDTPVIGPKKRQGRLAGLGSDEALVNLGRHLPPGADPVHALDQDPTITVEQIRWLSELSGLPVLVKGVLRGDDAARCLDHGAAGVVVSNHGGRQLDRAIASAHALSEVVAAVGGAAPVLVDGGIGSGLDVLAALALGADAVLVGRPVLWGLAVEGADGVHAVLAALTSDLASAMRLAGARTLTEVTPDLVTRTGAIDRSVPVTSEPATGHTGAGSSPSM